MNTLIISLLSAVLMGLGATLTFDLWGVFLKQAFKVTPSNICLVGRWLRYMPAGTFTHSNILSAPQKSAECTVVWIAHYLIGTTFASVFVAIGDSSWLQHPTPLPAIVFGVATVLAPFCILQPALGFGFAASKSSHPTQARLRSLMNHMAFGVGLYLFGWLLNGVLWFFA
jgi:hypothetical protein